MNHSTESSTYTLHIRRYYVPSGYGAQQCFHCYINLRVDLFYYDACSSFFRRSARPSLIFASLSFRTINSVCSSPVSSHFPPGVLHRIFPTQCSFSPSKQQFSISTNSVNQPWFLVSLCFVSLNVFYTRATSYFFPFSRCFPLSLATNSFPVSTSLCSFLADLLSKKQSPSRHHGLLFYITASQSIPLHLGFT